MNLLILLLDRADSLLKGKKSKVNLQPNPSLPPLEMYLQSQLLVLIDEFANIALMIDIIGGDRVSSHSWGQAQTEAFSEVVSRFTWE